MRLTGRLIAINRGRLILDDSLSLVLKFVELSFVQCPTEHADDH